MTAQQLAWLGSAIKDSKGERTQTTRAKQIMADGGKIRLPELRSPYLLRYLKSAGMYMQGAMGPVALSAAELRHWAKGTAKRLSAWEFATLLEASRAYVQQLSDDTEAPPFGSVSDLSDPRTISQRMARSLASLARPVKRKKK